ALVDWRRLQPACAAIFGANIYPTFHAFIRQCNRKNQASFRAKLLEVGAKWLKKLLLRFDSYCGSAGNFVQKTSADVADVRAYVQHRVTTLGEIAQHIGYRLIELAGQVNMPTN